MPPSSKPCQIQGQDDQLKLEENLPSWKLHLNPICEDPEVGQKLSELLLCFPKTLHVTLNLFLKSYLVLRNPNFCFVTYNKYQSLFLALFSKIIAQHQGSVASQEYFLSPKSHLWSHKTCRTLLQLSRFFTLFFIWSLDGVGSKRWCGLH